MQASAPADHLGRDHLTQLIDFLKHADEVIGEHQPRCELSGRCCRFTEYGHTLFISSWEAKLLLRDGLPPAATISADDCPFQVHNLCTAREKRPLGCRTYFCDPSYQEQMPDVTETLIKELKTLHDQQGINWDYRPLIKFLEQV